MLISGLSLFIFHTKSRASAGMPCGKGIKEGGESWANRSHEHTLGLDQTAVIR